MSLSTTSSGDFSTKSSARSKSSFYSKLPEVSLVNFNTKMGLINTCHALDAGPQLRTVDPAALKDIIQIVHSKLPAQSNAMRHVFAVRYHSRL